MMKIGKGIIMLVLIFSIQNIFSQGQIKIGTQIWSNANLKSSLFRNGDTIKEAKSKEEWDSALQESKPAWCYYNFNPFYEKTHGKIYNWYTIIDKRELAPIGWHIPIGKEYKELIQFSGGEKFAGKNLKSKFYYLDPNKKKNIPKVKKKSVVENTDFEEPPLPPLSIEEQKIKNKIRLNEVIVGWYEGEKIINTNKYNFNAVAGGYISSNGKFEGIGSYCYLWTKEGGYLFLYYNDNNADLDFNAENHLENGFSVRIVKD